MKYTFSFKILTMPLLQMSTTTPKVVMFNMEIGDEPSEEESADTEVDHNKLEEQVKELGQAIAGESHSHCEFCLKSGIGKTCLWEKIFCSMNKNNIVEERIFEIIHWPFEI